MMYPSTRFWNLLPIVLGVGVCQLARCQSGSELLVIAHGATNATPYPPAMVLEIMGPGSTNCLVEVSSDLLSWESLGTFYAHYAMPALFPTNNLFWDPLVEPVPVRFYRATSPARLEFDPYQLWSTNKPARYRYHYERCGAFVMSTPSRVEGDVHVENGVIRSLENVTGTPELTRQSMTNAFRTIDGLLQSSAVGKATRRRTVIFDSEWGYPRWILMETTDVLGKPGPFGSDLVTQFTVE